MVSAVIEPFGAALVPTGPDQPFDIGFHQDLQHRLSDGSQEIAIAALLKQFDKRHSLLGHRVLGGRWWLSQIHPIPPARWPPPDRPEFPPSPWTLSKKAGWKRAQRVRA